MGESQTKLGRNEEEKHGKNAEIPKQMTCMSVRPLVQSVLSKAQQLHKQNQWTQNTTKGGPEGKSPAGDEDIRGRSVQPEITRSQVCVSSGIFEAGRRVVG